MTHSKLKTLPSALLAALGKGAALSLVIAPITMAQAQTAQKVEKIEVTGSNIKRIDAEGPAPVVVIKKEDIDRSGSQTVSDLLRTLPLTNTGNFNESQLGGNTFAPGTAAISLRGLGATATLVLLNGRRIANYPFGQNVTQTFVDLNSIPISAIERIEVLKDGASAIYGSDALAGVVNIILRKDYRGVEVATSYGESSRKDGREQRYSISGGLGDVARDRYNVMATVDYYKRDAVWAKDRSFSATADHRADGGLDLRSPTGNPGTWLTAGKPGYTDNVVFPSCPADSRGLFSGTTTCYFNFQPFIYLLPPSERKGAFARGTFDVTPTFTLFAEAGYNKNSTENSAAPTPGSFTLPVGHNSNPYPFAVSIRYRFTDVGPRLSTIESESKRAVVGAKGEVMGWDWEVGYNTTKNHTESRQRGYVSQVAVNSLVSNGIYNFVNPSANPQALTDSLKANPYRIATSKLDSTDFKATRELFQLPAGPLAIALGGEHRKESVQDDLDPLSQQNLIVGSGGSTANGSRTLNSVYGEFSIPILKNVEGQLAVRSDNYSIFGRATKPKVAVSWKVAPEFLVRASYAGGFRAPSLSEQFLGQTVSFPAFVDTPRCTAYRAYYGNSDPRAVAVCGSNQVRTLSGGNPGLVPEESKSYNIGFVFEPIKEFSASLDLYRINHTNKIRQPSTTFQLANNIGVNRDPQSPTDILVGAPGVLQGLGSDTRYGLFSSYFNSARQLTQGVDLDLRYRVGIGEYGKLTFISTTNYIDYFKTQTAPGQPLVDSVSSYQFPRVNSSNSVFWTMGSWETGLTLHSRSNFAQNNQISQAYVAAFTTADFQLAYSGFKNLKLTFGITNLMDKKPPFSDNENDGYANSTDSPMQRYYYSRLVYSWK
jgi:iron complex outermembrane receptor protein